MFGIFEGRKEYIYISWEGQNFPIDGDNEIACCGLFGAVLATKLY